MIALSVDVDGRIIYETDRYADAVFDVVTLRPDWLPADLSFRQSGIAQILKQQFRDDLGRLGRGSERLRRLEDRDDGWFEVNDILAQEFRSIPTGPAAALWPSRSSLVPMPSYPLGSNPLNQEITRRYILTTAVGCMSVFPGMIGHGIAWVPRADCISIGDRGMHVTQQGSCMLIRTRLRAAQSPMAVTWSRGRLQPQELAFDPYGSLFAGDNDTAGADRSRLLHIVRDGDMDGVVPSAHEGIWSQRRRTMEGNVDDVLPSAGYVAQGPSGLLSTLKPAVARIFWPILSSDFQGVRHLICLKAPPIVSNRWNPGYGSFGPRRGFQARWGHVADCSSQQPNKGRTGLSPNDSNVGAWAGRAP